MTDKAEAAGSGALRLRICWILFAIWAAPFALSLVWPHPALGASTIALPVIVLVHGSILYGWRGIAVYLALGIVVGFLLEASSVANGFPFGSYTHNVAGPKPAGVAVSAILAYAFVGWFAWIIGKAAALDQPRVRGGFIAPVVAAIIIAGFDLPYDPIGATIRGDWTFAHPSGLYGVPLTNLLGWIFTGYVLFQLFALVERRFTPTAASADRSFWLLPCLVWIGMALQFPFQWMRAAPGTVSLGERSFVIADIYEGAIMTSIFAMLLPALLALLRIYQRPAATG